MRTLVLLAVLLLSACASAPAYAFCQYPWKAVQTYLLSQGATVTEMSPERRDAVGRWYNSVPPVTTHEFDAIYWVTAPGVSGLAFVVDGCVVAHERITPERLEALVPQA